METLEKRLGRLVGRLLQGGIIPFIGAGISLNAHVPGSDLKPTVTFMAAALRRELKCCLDEHCPQRRVDPEQRAAAFCWCWTT